MPNTGKPSQDCHLCRQRRVKCDLARPSCQRCTKYGAVCPGYRDQQELVFRNVNPSSIKRRKKRKGAGNEAAGNDAAAKDDDVEEVGAGDDSTAMVTCPGFVARREPASTSPGAMILHGHVDEHWEQQSVPLLLDAFSAMDFLRNVFGKGNRNGPLLWSAHIFTRTYIMNVRYPTEVQNGIREKSQRELSMYMGKTLRAINRALSTPEGARRDDILATVWILANYEVLSGTLGRHQPVNTWELHAKGIYSILRARGADAMRDHAGRTAFWPAFNLVQLQSLIINTACPPETEEWLSICDAQLYPGEELTLRIAQYLMRICEVQSQIMMYLRAADFRSASDNFLRLRQQMLDADALFEAYLGGSSPLREGRTDVTMDVYMHNLQLAAVIKSNHLMQMLCNLLTHYAPCPVSLEDLLAHRRYALHRIRAASQAVVGSLPAAMEPLTHKTVLKNPQVLFDAMKLVLPLFIVAYVPTTLQEHKNTALQALRYIGKEVGIWQALRSDGPTLPLPEEARAPLVVDLLLEPPWVEAPPRDYTTLGF